MLSREWTGNSCYTKESCDGCRGRLCVLSVAPEEISVRIKSGCVVFESRVAFMCSRARRVSSHLHSDTGSKPSLLSVQSQLATHTRSGGSTKPGRRNLRLHS